MTATNDKFALDKRYSDWYDSYREDVVERFKHWAKKRVTTSGDGGNETEEAE